VRRSRAFDERGVVGGADAVAFGMLILVVSSLIAINAWQVIAAKSSAQQQAKSAATRLSRVQSGTEFTVQLASISSQLGDDTTLAVLDDTTRRPVRRIARCQRIVVEVTTTVTTQRIPFVEATAKSRQVRATATAVVAPFTNGSLDPITDGSSCA
jgi:hypothetical protein